MSAPQLRRRYLDGIDYAAESARQRRAQGLPVDIPQHQREAVEALLTLADALSPTSSKSASATTSNTSINA